MTNININEVRKEIIAKGLMSEDLMIECNKKSIHVTGEWDMDDNIIVDKVKVGVFGDDVFFKGIEMDIELPSIVKDEDYEVTKSTFKKNIELMYPEYIISLRID